MAVVSGCNTQMPSSDELAAFKNAGSTPPSVDLDKVVQAKPPVGSYRIVVGDLLSIHVPFLSSQSNEASEHQGILLRRVEADGSVTLPMVDQIGVAGKSVGEAEAVIAGAYYPRHIVNRPAVVVQLTEYDTRYVEITGGVLNPGRYQLRSGDELSLVSLLARSGNIIAQGASVIRITPAGQKQPLPPVVLPVKGLNMPFTDVTLKGGETIEVEKLNPQTFTVMGLVKLPGTYGFPPDQRINLVQALGTAGGTDVISDPRYATIYRQNPDGTVVSARFQLNGKTDSMTKASLFTDSTYGASAFVSLKPGDVISVEHDVHTRMKSWLAQVLVFRAGGSAYGETQATYFKDYSPHPNQTINAAPIP
jgi:polysaccharide export outer membrane protein